MMRTLDFAIRSETKPPNGREETYAFAEFVPTRDIRPDGTLSPLWEAVHITRVDLPLALPYLDGAHVARVAVHVKAAPSLARALREIERAGLYDYLSPYGGGFTFRRISGSHALSMHSLGLALDFDPDHNPRDLDPKLSRFGSSGEGLAVVRLFELYGWYWGGRFTTRPDAMHFQFATGC